MKAKKGMHLGKPRTRYSQENTAFLPTKLTHEAQCFCASHEKWHQILKTDWVTNAFWEAKEGTSALEEHELNTVTCNFPKTSKYDSIMGKIPC